LTAFLATCLKGHDLLHCFLSKALVIYLLRNKLALLAPAGFAVGLHIRYVSPLIMVNTYPEDW